MNELTAAWRGEFPGLEQSIYLNTCSLGQLSRRSMKAMQRFMELWQRYGASAWYELWWGELADARARFARLINAQPHEIAILPNVGVALSVIASSLDYAERPEIVVTEMDFPTLPYQWMARGREGAQVRLLHSTDRIGVDLDAFAAAINTHTALVATTHVFFTSGWIQDIAAIAELAHNRGALCLVDGYQAAGQLPVDVKAAGVDIYLSGGLKWLLGGPGVVFMYVREELIDRLEPTTTGWFAAKEMFKFNPVRFERADDARRFEPGTPAVAAVYAANAGMSIIEEIGPAAVRARTRELVADLAARLRAAGLAPRLPQDMDRHAGIVMLPAAQPAQTVAALKDRRIIVDHRPGAVRLSPYFYNTEAENQAVVDAIGDALASQGAEDGP
ncbi:MAG: aminotransferase class V-fold PLP-dependent enzyme [Chloroflexota bacterium]|nr:aminotransferase class V-fold PLP-dependent enzyme [Chloroflexota bacterium]